MDWDQIESKWAAMTRRVRADLPFAKGDTKARTVRRTIMIEGPTPVITDQPLSVDETACSATSSK